jgi:hypothetical protein
MTEEACEKAAEDFIQAMRESPTLRDEWVVFARNRDWKGLRELIAGALRLTETPSVEDLERMHAYAKHHLEGRTKELQELDQRIDRVHIFNGR